MAASPASVCASAGGPASDVQIATQATALFLHSISHGRRPSHASKQSVILDWHAVLHCWVLAEAVSAKTARHHASTAIATDSFIAERLRFAQALFGGADFDLRASS
jgi:hypothetical protein